MLDVVPGSTRQRGAKMIINAAALDLVLRLAGFHKLFLAVETRR